MKCKQCNNELTGKKVYCDDACRMAYGRRQPEQPEHAQPEQTQPEHQPEQGENRRWGLPAGDAPMPAHYVTRTNPEQINYGKPLSKAGLEQARLKANRVPIPGDHDYEGCCVQVDGQWKVRA